MDINIPKKVERTKLIQAHVTNTLFRAVIRKCKTERIKRTDVVRALLKEWVEQ